MTNEPTATTPTDPMTGASGESLAAGTVARRDPHFVLGIVGFALTLIALLNIVGLVLSIIAFVKSKRAGFTNGFALAGLIIGGLGVLFLVVFAAVAVPALVDAAQTCARLGDGVHELDGATYTCTPNGFNVQRGY